MQRNHRTDLSCQDQRPADADEWRFAQGHGLRHESIIDWSWTPPNDATPARRSAPRPQRGFTLIEMLITVTIAGILSSVALPSFEGLLQRARRSDVLVSMVQIQSAQERFRSNGSSYGSLSSIGVAARSTSGHYAMEMTSFDAQGYEVLAVATGAQARDTACSKMKLTVIGANLVYASGPDASVANPADVNRRCWSL